MKISFIDLIRSAFEKRDAKFRQRLVIFLICLVISVIIWFTIKLSDDYDTVIQMPVTFVNLPKNRALTYASDTMLQVEVLDKGSDLFRMLYFEDVPRVPISLRFLPLYQKGGAYHGFISPSSIINDIEREQDLLGKIVSVSPDTIYLSFEPEKSRKLPVTASFDLTFEKQYMRSGAVLFTPDCVTVRGPEKIIEKLDSVSIGKIKLGPLRQNYTGEVTFRKDSINHDLSFNPFSVTFNIPVEKFTEAEMEVPVKVINTNGLNIKTFPDKVRVFYTVALKDYPKVEAGMILVVADLSKVNVAREDKIKIMTESYPSFIHINKTDPEKVEFIIIK